MRTFSSVETVLHSYVNWTVRVRSSHSLGVPHTTPVIFMFIPFQVPWTSSWANGPLHTIGNAKVQSLFFPNQVKWDTSQPTRNELTFSSGQLVIDPVPFSSHSIPWSFWPKILWSQWKDSPWSGLSFDNRKTKLKVPTDAEHSWLPRTKIF